MADPVEISLDAPAASSSGETEISLDNESSDGLNLSSSNGVFQPQKFLASARKRASLRAALENQARGVRSAFGAESALTPADHIQIDQDLNTVVPLNDLEREAEARLRGDPKWNPYDAGKVSKWDRDMATGAGKWTGLGYLSNAYSSAPKRVQDVVNQGVLGVGEGLNKAIIGTITGAITLGELAVTPIKFGGLDNRTLGVIAKENLWALSENLDKYTPDLSENHADPNREAGYVRDESGKRRFVYDDSDPSTAPDVGINPMSASRFFGNLTGQVLFMLTGAGLIGKMTGLAGTGVKTLAEIEKAHKLSAGFMTLASVGQTQKELKDGLLQKGVKPDVAEDRSMLASVLLAPLQYSLNKIGPLSKIGAGKPLAERFPGAFDNWLGTTLSGTLLNGIQGAGDRSLVEIAKYGIGSQGLTWQNLDKSLLAVLEAGGTEAVGGAFISQIDTLQQFMSHDQKALIVDEAMLNYRDPTAFNKRQLYNQAFLEFTSGGHDQAHTLTELVDGVAERMAMREGKTKDEMYAMAFAGTMDRYANQSGLTLFQPAENVAQMYSKLEKVLNSTGFRKNFKGKQKPEEIRTYLKNQGVKDEELKWSGFDWLLIEQPGKAADGSPLDSPVRYNGDEILEFHRKNMVRLETVKKGGQSITDSPEALAEQRALGEEMHRLDGELDKLTEKEHSYKQGDPKALEVREQRRQTALRRRDVETKLRDLQTSFSTTYDSVTLPGPRSNYQEWLMLVPQQKQASGERGKISQRNGHWNEENVLVHVRADVRETPQGKTLFVNEIQSDWHQEGRERGYQNELNSEQQARITEIDAEMKTLWEALSSAEKYDSKPNIEITRLAEEKMKILGGPPGQPKQGPHSETWTELALKKILIEAANQGHSRVTIATGEMNDLFQGVIDTEQSLGRHEFYDLEFDDPRMTEDKTRVDEKTGQTKMVKLKKRPGIVWTKLKKVLAEAGVKEPKIEMSGFDIGQKSAKGSFDFATLEETSFRNQDLQEDFLRVMSDHYVALNEAEGGQGLALKSLSEDLHRLAEHYPSAEYKRFLEKFDKHLEDITIEMKAPTLVLSPTDAQRIRDNGFSLFAPDYRAAVTLLDNGRAIIHALKNPDLGSLVHEIGHIIRRSFVDQKDHTSLERLFGVKNNKWTVEQEEAFAQTFTRWLRGDKGQISAISPKHYTTFVKLENYLKDIFLTAKSLKGSLKPNAEFEGIMRRMFLEDTNPIQAAELVVTQREAELENAKLELTKATGALANKLQTPVGTQLLAQAQAAVDKAKSEFKLARTELRRVVESELVRGPDHPSLARARRLQWIERLATGPMQQQKFWHEITGALPWAFGFLKSYGDKLGSSDVANAIRILSDDIEIQANVWSGKFRNVISDVFTKLLDKDTINDLATIEPGVGIPNFVRQFDMKGVPSQYMDMRDTRFDAGFKLYESMYNFVSDLMTAERTIRQLPTGAKVEFKESPELTIPRMLTEEGFDMLGREGHAAHEAFKKWVLAHNPGVSEVDFKRWIDQEITSRKSGNAFTRRAGQVEGSRKIKYIPFQVQYKDTLGITRNFNVFHHDPVELAIRWVANASKRIAIIRSLGQSMLPDKFLAVGDMRNLLRWFGVRTQLNRAELEAKMQKNGIWDSLKHSKASMRVLLRDAHAALGKGAGSFSAPDLYAMVEGLHWRQIVDKQYDPDPLLNTKKKRLAIASITDLARKVGRIEIPEKMVSAASEWIGFPEMVNGLKERLGEKIIDNGRELLRQAFHNRGGNVDDFDNIWSVFQGRPIFNVEQNALTRTFSNTARISGSLMTSLSGLPNLTQPLLMTGEFGPVKVAKAYKDVLNNYTELLRAGREMGAIRLDIFRLASEKSHWASRAAENISKVISSVTLTRRIGELNDVVAFRIGQLQADEWKAGGLGLTGESTARFLRLTDPEIDKIRAGMMDDLLYKKVVQQTVRVTQGRNENPVFKSYLEQNSLLGTFFQFNSYTTLMTRWGWNVSKRAVGDFKLMLKNPTKENLQTSAVSMTKLMFAMGVALGVGELARLVRDAATKRPTKKFETVVDRIVGDLVEVQMLGHASRFFSPSTPWAMADPVLALSPSVSNISDFLSHVVFGFGRARNQNIAERVGTHLLQTTPAAKAADRQFEYWKYPRREQFDKARNTYNQWARAQAWFEQDVSEHSRDEGLFDVYEEIARGRYREASARYGNYLHGAFGKYMNDGRDPSKLLQNSRQSLLNRRPIPLGNPVRKAQFLRSLTEEQRTQALKLDTEYVAVVKALTGASN